MQSRIIIVTSVMNIAALSNGYGTEIRRIKNMEVISSIKSASIMYSCRTKYRDNLSRLRLENG